MVADKYADWLAAGVHVITPNKKANSGDLKRFEATKAAAAKGDAHWLYEGTIGAGLPIVSTLRTLRASGDEVRSVQGIFSGTMSFLFNTWNPSEPFSAVVLAAKEAGFTEPDPRDDLNGLDVARESTPSRSTGETDAPPSESGASQSSTGSWMRRGSPPRVETRALPRRAPQTNIAATAAEDLHDIHSPWDAGFRPGESAIILDVARPRHRQPLRRPRPFPAWW